MEVKGITEAAADLTTGTVLSAVDAISNPGRTARRLERKGQPARKAAVRDINDVRETTHEAAASLLPERLALRGLSLVKARARRVDLVGELAYRGLDLFHGSLKGFSSTIARLERASEPPARGKRPVGRAARTSATQTRTNAKRTVRRTRRTARRAATA